MNRYETVHQFEFELENERLQVSSKPGLPDWDQLPPTSSLIARYIRPLPGDRILLLGSGHGALAAWLSRRIHPGELWVMDQNIIAYQMTEKTLQANQITNGILHQDIWLPETTNGSFDRVVIQLPKGRKLAQRWLAAAHAALRPQGYLYLSGAKSSGIQSVIEDAQSLIGPGSILGYKKGCRLAVFQKNENLVLPEWSHLPGVQPKTWHTYSLEIAGRMWEIAGLPGVFSFDRLDDGTRLLLDHLPAMKDKRVLDLGCGSGIIGMIAAIQGANWVDLLDSDLAAVACAQRNIAKAGIQNAEAQTSDCAQAVWDRHYDVILSNPPFHAGKAVDYSMAQAFIVQSRQLLNPDGRLVVVANRFIRYDQIMQQNFPQVEILAQTGKFHVITAAKI